jgi:hypothetical protein
MPCHPDRVRRHYEQTCTICGSGERAHVLESRGHAFRPPWRRPSDTNAVQLERRSTDTGVTANVIEGDHH